MRIVSAEKKLVIIQYDRAVKTQDTTRHYPDSEIDTLAYDDRFHCLWVLLIDLYAVYSPFERRATTRYTREALP